MIQSDLLLLQQKSPAQKISGLLDWQSNALQDFLQRQLPDQHDEEWKYTRLATIQNTHYMMPSQINHEANIPLDFVEESFKVVFVDGQFRPELSHLQDLPPGIVVTNILSVLNNSQWLSYITQDQRYQTAFSQLNAALLTDGIFISVAKQCRMTKPIHCIYYHSAHPNATMFHPRHLVVAEKESELTVIEEYRALSGNYFNNVVTHIFAEEGSIVKHYKVQDEAKNASHIATTTVTQARNSSVFSYAISLGGTLSRDDLNFNLQGNGASCHLYGFYFPQGAQHIDHHTRVDHLVPQCFSQQIYKGIIANGGRAVFNGKVYVHPDAQKTAAYQNNQNLLLEDNAEIDTKPELEIYADDVKCTHGATVGQLDENALFYLRSRGIELSFARRLLMKAFAEEILANIAEPDIAQYVQKKINYPLEVITL